MSDLIPADFPRDAVLSSLAGVHPKLAVIRDGPSGTYISGPDSASVAERHALCVDLARQLAEKCARNRKGKYRDLSDDDILRQLLQKLLKSGWGSPAEMAWTIREAAKMLGWPWSNDCESPL